MLHKAELVQRTADHVREELSADSTGHDWWHVERVWRLATHIGRQEGADLFVVELAALLHDVADWKFHGGDETAGPRAARAWLEKWEAPPAVVDRVAEIVGTLSFKGAGVASHLTSIEGKIVQDADRIDALGAIGIARAFAYGGHAGRPLYDPAISPERHDSFAAYQSSRSPTINHFYEKLLLLKDRLHTATARAIASDRHLFMEEFLRRFYGEWNLTDAGIGPAASPKHSVADERPT